jgi:hypothetical protein
MSTTGEGSAEDDVIVAPGEVVPDESTKVSTTPPVEPVEQDSGFPFDFPVTGLETSGDAEDEDESVPDVVEFDPAYRKSFEGLLFIGKVQRTFNWLGHTFLIKTPTIEEMLEAGQLHQPYVGTIGDIKAWQSLMVAASLVTVDNKPLPIPISDDVTALQSKFNYINQHWYPWTTDALYEQYILLDNEVREVIDAMGKA